MTDLKTSKGEFVVVDLPIDCHVSQISLGGGETDLAIGFPDGTFKRLPFNYKLICKLSETTEEQAKGVVDDLRSEDYKYTDSLDSLHSLLKSKGIDVNNGNWYLFKKI